MRGGQLVREEAVSIAQVTDGEAWIRTVAVGRRCEGGGVARHLGFWSGLGSKSGAHLSKILA